MKLKNLEGKDIAVSMSLEELETISNALNEVCNALDGDEFETRMGASIEEARALLNQISKIFDQL